MKQRFYASIALLLVAVLTAALLCGCHSKPENSSDETSSVGSVPTTESDSNSMPAITPDESSGDTTPNGTNGSVAGTEKKHSHFQSNETACHFGKRNSKHCTADRDTAKGAHSRLVYCLLHQHFTARYLSVLAVCTV